MFEYYNKINVFWYKVPFGRKNFGDEVGPYIINKLSGKSIAYIPYLHNNFKDNFVNYIRSLATMKIGVVDMFNNILFFLSKDKSVIISIGSILSWHTVKSSIIWGAGIMSRKDKIFDANFLAVRGKYTQKRLDELGFKVPNAIGDPALLLPLVYMPNKILKEYKLGIIPHHSHFEEITNKINNNSKIKIINLLDPIEKVIDEILECDYTISSSLHGIIVSHAYEIPSLWYNLSKKLIGGDNIKYADYFSSLEMEEYDPFDLNFSDKFNDDNIIKSFEKYNKRSIPDMNNVKTLQKGLISAAPFKILNKYK